MVGGGCVYWGIILFKVLCYLVSCYIEYKVNLLFNISECFNCLIFFDILYYVSNVILK